MFRMCFAVIIAEFNLFAVYSMQESQETVATAAGGVNIVMHWRRWIRGASITIITDRRRRLQSRATRHCQMGQLPQLVYTLTTLWRHHHRLWWVPTSRRWRGCDSCTPCAPQPHWRRHPFRFRFRPWRHRQNHRITSQRWRRRCSRRSILAGPSVRHRAWWNFRLRCRRAGEEAETSRFRRYCPGVDRRLPAPIATAPRNRTNYLSRRRRRRRSTTTIMMTSLLDTWRHRRRRVA